MATEQFGRNILLKYDTGTTKKLFAGTTSNSFDLSIETTEALTKSDAGQPRIIGTKQTGSISIEGLVTINEAGDVANQVDKNDIMDLVLARVAIDFVYGPAGSGSVVRKGKVLLTSYSESSDSEGLATFSVSGTISGAITKETLAS